MKKDNSNKLTPTGAEQEALMPLNNKLYSEFSLQELEERLETDPLLLASFLDIERAESCGCKKKCTNKCTCDGSSGDGFCVGHCEELGIEPIL